MIIGIEKELRFQNHFGLELRQNGSEIDDGLVVKKPLGCNKIGISYLAWSNKQNKYFVVRELIPSLQSKPINNVLVSLNNTGLKEFTLSNKLLFRNWIEGLSVEQYLLAKEQIPATQIVKIAQLIAIHLKKLHEVDIVHGSLHENNIIVSDKVSIIDNHLPSSIRDNAFRELQGQIFDTTTHIAPERLRGRPFDKSSDWYSFATVIWRMFTGLPPYYVGDIVTKKVEGIPFDSEFPDIREFTWFKQLLLDMLATNPELRLADSILICNSLEAKSYSSKRPSKISTGKRFKKHQLQHDISATNYTDKNSNAVMKAKNGLWNRVSISLIFFVLLICILLGIGFIQRGIKIESLKNEQEKIIKERDNLLGAQSTLFTKERKSAEQEKSQIVSRYETKEDSILGELGLYKQKYQSSREEIQSLNNQISDMDKRFKTENDLLKSEIETLKGTINSKSILIAQLEQEKKALQSTLNNIRKENSSLIDSLRAEKRAYEDEIKKLNNQIKAIQQTRPQDEKIIFKITEQSLEELRAENIPEEVLIKLKTLINYGFTTQAEFLDVVKSKIGPEQTNKYRSMILKHAENKQR